MVCNRDCFNCIYPDCIDDSDEKPYVKQSINKSIDTRSKTYYKAYREQNKERLKESHKKWYEAHKEEIAEKRKASRLKQYKVCTYCGKTWHGEAIMYKRKAFCDSECLCKWLSDQGLIKILRERVKT